MPARNEARIIPAAVSSVNASRNVPTKGMHLLVCANACTDQTVDVLEQLKGKHKNMEYITESVPGKPRALNALIDKAEQTYRMGNDDVVVFLDADARVQPETISSLTAMLKKNKGLNAVSANDVAPAPLSDSVMDHLLFGVSEVSLSALALRDRKASCTAVRGKAVRGMRFPEHVISDDLWMTMYLGADSVETHPNAFVVVQRPSTFMDFASQRIRHLMGLYQLEEFYPAHEVRGHLPMGTHEHVQALLGEPELQDQFAQLPDIYKFSTLLAVPVHAVFKAAAWIGYRLMPQTRNHSVPVPKNTHATRMRSVSPAHA
jgi:cellulose synthase/poly-beta-1,6-N-acetylglucosamine synthase-like glycosyltransferase